MPTYLRGKLAPLAGLLIMLATLNACSAPDRPTIPLFLAMQRGDIDQVERHLYWGADINEPFPNGSYPIDYAAAQGQVVMLQLLLKHGADTSVETPDGRTALQLALLAGRTRTAEVLLKAGAKMDPSALLLQVAKANISDRDVVRFLTRHGADINATDGAGNTALIIATRLGNHRLVHHLIEQGANVALRNHQDQTALDIARRQGARNIARFLEQNGAVTDQ